MTGGLRGDVRDADGRPVVGALVHLVPLRETPPVPDLAVLTDGAGAFRWPAPLPVGDYRVEVATPTGRAGAEVAVPPGATARVALRG